MKTFKSYEERLIWKILNHSIIALVAFSLLISCITSINKIFKVYKGHEYLEPHITFFLIVSVLSSLFCLFVFFFKRQKRKYVFKNYNPKFLWIISGNYIAFKRSYDDDLGGMASFPFLMLFEVCFLWYHGYNILIETNDTGLTILLQLFTGVFFLLYYKNYKVVRDGFPDPRRLVFLMNREGFIWSDPDPLILQTKYIDFVNNKIEDDNPCLTVGQSFRVKIKEFPKNELEKSEIQILNPNTPKPSLVTIIEHTKIAEEIKNGKAEINTELLSIGEFGNLEIGIWVRDIKPKE